MGRFSWCATSSSSDKESMDSSDEDKGFPRKCKCGSSLTLTTIPDGVNIGRLVYRCENAGSCGFHNAKWWDACVKEELEKLKSSTLDLENTIRCQSRDEQGNFVTPVMVAGRVSYLQTDVARLKEDVYFLQSGYTKLMNSITKRENERLTTMFKVFLTKLEYSSVTKVVAVLTVVLAFSLMGNLYLFLR